MALSRYAYRALEDIVGPRYISVDPAVMDSYAHQWLAETVRPNHSKFMPRPEAALLPASTREVQAIVRICNKYKMKFKAHSTGWYFYGAPLSEGVIQLDMRRMDHILEIDEKNMFAVIEPYVIAGVLQAEVIKRGLNCTVTGAGASCATLVGATCYHGSGGTSIYTGELRENLLGAEWVMPNGEILKEMRQSARIIAQCLDQMPEGPIMADVPHVIPPPKAKVMRDMESLIHHFIIFTQGFKPPKGETYCATEAPKGELGFFLVSDGSPRPYRLKIRAPSFIHMGAFDHMARGYLISDIITIFGTYDIVMGECDR